MQPQRRKSVFILVGILAVVLLAASLYMMPKARQRWEAPLGPGLELPTYTPAAAALLPELTQAAPVSQTEAVTVVADPATSGSQATEPPPMASTATPASTPTPKPLCGGPPVMLALGVGADNRDNSYQYGLGDVIRAARIDFVTPKITVLTFPRDLWVEIPGISDHYDISEGKLNQAYLYGNPGMGYYDEAGAGPGLLARTLDLNFGLRVDHYGAVNMQTFVKIVDAVGGLDIYLPNAVDGRPIDKHTEDMGYFNAGQHHFSGKEALRFARIRKRYNDFTRADFQTMVICALKEKLISPAVLPKIPQIISAFQGQVLTDLSLEQISQLACLLPQVKRENLIFTSFPQELFEPGRVFSPQQEDTTFILEADYDVLRDYVSQFVAGTWPTEPDEPSCP